MKPSHFKPTVLGNLLKFFNGKSIKPGGDGAYLVYGSNGLIGRSGEYTHQNGLIIGRVGAYCGAIKYCKTNFWASDNTIVGQPKDISFDIEYIYYLLGGLNLNRYAGGSAQPLLTQTVLRQVPTSIPPLPTQRKIANFLNRNTQQIDDLIRVKERKIELLGEYRASLIHQAETKGLDPNVEMNPSGVEWIGNVPKHWEVKKIKYLARLISKGTTPTTIGREILDHGEIRFIKAENIVDNQVKLDPEYYIDEETNQMLKRSQLKENDILFVIAGTIGKVGLVSRNHLPANTNQAVSFIRPYEKELPEFIYYWLQSDNIQQIVWRDVVQTAQPNLSMEDLGNLYIPYPSIAEQERIVDYISNKTRSIAQLLQQVYRQIELLKEYRQSLISAVVTGKIDVRNEV